MVNWKEIHSDFTPKLQVEWKKWWRWDWKVEETTKDWIKVGLHPTEAQFAKWLENKYYIPFEEVRNRQDSWKRKEYKVFNQQQKENLKTEYLDSWGDIHPSFVCQDYGCKNENGVYVYKTFKQEWQEAGFNKSETKSWMEIGFEPDNQSLSWLLNQIQLWKNQGFSVHEAKEWLEAGLRKVDGEFASWLKKNNHSFQTIKSDLDQLRNDYNQYWLTKNYPDKNTEWLIISEENLTGKLFFNQYQRLKWLHCFNNSLSQTLECFDFLINLEHLNLRKTNFYGSLAPLGNLSKLNFLDISYTKLDADIEFLPSSLETIIAEGIPEIEKKMKVESFDFFPSLFNYQIWRNNNVKNILIVGKTGSGKSTLCDLLTAKTSDSEKDKESSENTNKTKEIQIKELEQEFEVNQGKKSKITYRIIDTPSAFDIFSASSQKPLKTILEIFKVGVNQILFVIDGNFNQHDMNIYNFLRKETIFDQDIVNYVTIVRTNFNDFDNEEKCKEDIKKSVKKDSKLSELIELFQGRIIHVDNPSLEVKNKDELEFNKERRNKSRNKIVDHLNKNCQSVYKFKPKETIRDELISELRKIKDTTLAVLVITLERLFVIKDNTKKFVDKWGKEVETNWYEKLLASLNIKKVSLNELSELQSPKQYNKYSRLLSIIQWVNRSALIASGALLVNGQQDMSNWTTLVSPFVEIIISRLQIENEEKKNKWYEFTKDTENLLENYHELSRMLKQIKEREFGEVNRLVNNLRKKTEEFLKKYSKSEKEAISALELVEKKKELEKDLSKEKSQLREIISTIKTLENEVIECRQNISGKEEIIDEWLENISKNNDKRKEIEEINEEIELRVNQKFELPLISNFWWNGKESESKTKYQICQEREKDLEIADYSNLDKLNISEDPQEESSIQVQIEIPPK